MTIPFTCPHCGVEFDVADRYAGQTGLCAKCGKPIHVPAFGKARDRLLERARSSMTTLVIVLVGWLKVLLLCGGLPAALLLPPIQAAREAARRTHCTDHVRELSKAVRRYDSLNHSLPPAYTTDADGKPLLSWRVLLLPYLDEAALYDQFRLDEPWDSPHNRALAARMPRVYRCPSDCNVNSQETSYVLITGRGTAFEGAQAVKFRDLERGTLNTVFFAESSESGIIWTEPRDVDVSALNQGLDAPPGQGLRSAHPEVVNVGYADGHVESLDKGMSPQVLIDQTQIKGQNPPIIRPAERP
jgi:prepilin-type processing-associated H-X9-DG protein